MDKKQLIAAINNRMTRKLWESELASLDRILFTVEYHPELKGISVEELAGRLVNKRGLFGDYDIRQMFPTAVAKAKEQGYPLEEQEDITSRYQVAFGFCVNEKPKTIGEVFQAVQAKLEECGLLPDEYFSLSVTVSENDPWPRGRWVASYAVTGSNEGHYLHVGVVVQHDEKWLKETHARYVGIFREAEADAISARLYANALLRLERTTETLIPVLIGKTCREGASGMALIYKSASKIAELLA
jgi:hypothetical protein